jgi:uncharacterized membrane protein YeaQ/YmgE (transglycosylase-associated protein family)
VIVLGFEILTWVAFGLFVGLLQVYMRRERRPWPMVIGVAVFGALLGGGASQMISHEDRALGAYDMQALFLAVVGSLVLTLIFWGTGRKLEPT